MPAQVILLEAEAPEKAAAAKPGRPAASAKPGGVKAGKPKSPPSQPDQPPPGTKYPPWRPINISSVAVFGQKPHALGHFDDMTALVASLRNAKVPGGSNTVFATVKSAKDMHSKSFRQGLGKLPDALTIVVKPVGPDA